MTERWTKGGWQPKDWGLQHDPIQTGMEQQARAIDPLAGDRSPKRIRSDRAPIPRWRPHEPATWFAYVLDFQKRFKLDPGQKTTANSIHAELLARANSYISAHAERLDKVARRDRAEDQAYEPIRGLFEELKERLDALPRSAQRDQIQP
jgi:hypothetical protein